MFLDAQASLWPILVIKGLSDLVIKWRFWDCRITSESIKIIVSDCFNSIVWLIIDSLLSTLSTLATFWKKRKMVNIVSKLSKVANVSILEDCKDYMYLVHLLYTSFGIFIWVREGVKNPSHICSLWHSTRHSGALHLWKKCPKPADTRTGDEEDHIYNYTCHHYCSRLSFENPATVHTQM